MPDFTINELSVVPSVVAVGGMVTVTVQVEDFLTPTWWQAAEVQSGEV